MHAKAAVNGVNSEPVSLVSAKSATDTFLTQQLPGPASYNDNLVDAGGSVLSPTQIGLDTSVQGVLGLRYSATQKDTADYFTFTVPKTGVLQISQYGDRLVNVNVATETTHLMDNKSLKYQYSDPWLGFESEAQVFAGEHIIIQLTGSGAPSPGSGAGPTDGLAYGFSFSLT